MKIVTCKNCGANYQLDDDDDISAYECSSCAGSLELLDQYPSEQNSTKSTLFSPPVDEDDIIIQCEDCGLKYRLNQKENILNYECESCGGSLKYIDDDLNKEVENFNTEYNSDKKKESSKKKESNSFESFFSDEYINLEEKKTPLQTARTRIPASILSRFSKEFEVPQTNDYFILKEYLKKKLYKNIETEYLEESENSNQSNITKNSFFDRFSLKEPNNNSSSDKQSLIPYPNEKYRSYHYVYLIIGLIFGIIGILDILSSNRGYGYIFISIGIIVVCIGLYKTKDYGDVEKRGKIIREKLLTLPEEYYVLYYVRAPGSSSGINHVVIGPSGIYSIVTQKYNTKKDNERLKSENETIEFIKDGEDELMKSISENNSDDFKYTVKEDKFEHDNKIKQKSLRLGENLINFLNDNGFKNYFVEPLVGFVNNEVAVINMPLTDEDLFLDELINNIKTSPTKLDTVTVHKCAVLLSQYATDCSS